MENRSSRPLAMDITEIDDPKDKDFGNYDFPFENLVMEGGGVRGVAHVGALRVLESAGILKNIKRVAGTSVGAIMATLVALGLSSDEIAKELDKDMRDIILTGGIARLAKPFMFFRRLGWDTGEAFYEYCGDFLKESTGNPDITFKELHEMKGKRGIDLCIVVTNLTQQREIYCHIKTTPDLTIRRALRMSTSIPVLFQPVVEDYFGVKEYFVDGGVACNYPLHCFDGWWLSMKDEDSFFTKLKYHGDLSTVLDRSERFEPMNPKTIGIVLYSDDDIELFEQEFWNRLTPEERQYDRPDTPSAKDYKSKRKVVDRTKIRSLVNRFLGALKNDEINPDSEINRKQLDSIFEKEEDMTDAERKDFVSQLFEQMDTNRNGQLTYDEIQEFLDNKGLHWLMQRVGWSKEQDKRWRTGDYISKYLDLFAIRNKKFYHQAADVDRTIGVDTNYVKTKDFDMEDEDRMFLFKRGASGARAFLRRYKEKNKLQPKTA